MIIVEFSVAPLGTSDTSLSDYVSEACKVVDKSGLKYILTPMSTIMEAESVKEAMEVVERAHEAVIKAGAKRVVTNIKIDDRRDRKGRRMEDKVNIVKSKLSR
jgi:uncharacterized protein (TIGR00106 family)